MTKVQYIGHSAFALEHDGKQILIDPYITGNPVASVTPDGFSPDTILLTHAHNDHVGDTIDIAKRSGAEVIATFELAEWIDGQGVKRTQGCNHGGTASFDGGTVKFVPAWHTSSYSIDGKRVAIGIPSGLVVRFGGKTMYFAGDTCLFSDMKLIGEEGLDVAVVPIGDYFTMGPADAVRAVSFLKPALVIPCHFNTFPPIRQDADAFKARVEEKTAATCHPLKPGESLDLA